MKQFLAKLDPGYFVAALLPLIGILPSMGSGVINTADGPLHVQRIYAMALMLGTSNLWPRWVPYFHVGYGYPIFNFYPPGVFQLGAVLVRLGIDAAVAFNLVAAGGWMLGSVGTYALARLFLPGRAAVLAAMLWAYAPSRLFEVWDQGSLPQMIAAALIPWLFWGMVWLAREPSRWGLLGVALPLAGIILTHQPMTFITALYAAPLALILAIFYTPSHPAAGAGFRMARCLITLVSGLALGVALTMIFLLPLALELRYVKSSEIASDTVPYLISNFLKPAEVFMQPPMMDLTDLRFELFTSMGVVGGLLAAFGLGALVWRRRYHLALILGLGLAFTIFMLLENSLQVWLTIPLFAQLRFPERFLRVGAVLIALAGGASILLLPRRWQNLGLAAGLTVTLMAALPLIYPNQHFITWENLSAADEINMELTAYTWGSTSYNEFNPMWGEKILFDEPETSEYVDDPMRLTVYRLDMIRQWPDLQVEELDTSTIRVSVTDARPVRFRQYYFPGWAATLDGQRTAIYPEDEIGLIALDVPAGEHIIELWYEGTPAQAAGTLVTVAAILICAALMVSHPKFLLSKGRGTLNGKFTPRQQEALYALLSTGQAKDEGISARAGLFIAASVTAFALFNTFVIAPHTRLFRHESPPDQPAYMQHEARQSFGGLFELMGYTLSRETIAPGRSLDVMLFWRAQAVMDREYRPIVQLVNLGVSEAWAVSEPFFPGGGSTANGYPQDRFASEVHELRVIDDALPNVGRIMVKMVDSRTGEPLRLPDGSDYWLLPDLIRVSGNGPVVNKTLDAQLGTSVELWCASVHDAGDAYTIDVYWHITSTPPADLQTFIHGLDAQGEIVAQGDAQPLGGSYPSALWLGGQTLYDSYTLTRHPAMTRIAIGLYTTDGRLPVTQSGQRVEEDRVMLDISEHACTP